MPIYEYRCPKCNKVFEEWCPHITEDHPKEPCPDCGTISPRIISNTSFVLEGGGWYVTDYGYRKGIKDETSAPSHGTSGASHEPAPQESAAATKTESETKAASSTAKPAAAAPKSTASETGAAAAK